MRIDAGGHAQQDLLHRAPGGRQFAQAHELVLAVHHEIAHARVHGVKDVRVGLVVAVEEGPLHRESGLHRREDLAGRNHIDAHFLLPHDPVHMHKAGRLAGICGRRLLAEAFGKGRLVQAAVFPDAVLIEQVQGRTETLGQIAYILARKAQMAGFIDGNVF